MTYLFGHPTTFMPWFFSITAFFHLQTPFPPSGSAEMSSQVSIRDTVGAGLLGTIVTAVYGLFNRSILTILTPPLVFMGWRLFKSVAFLFCSLNVSLRTCLVILVFRILSAGLARHKIFSKSIAIRSNTMSCNLPTNQVSAIWQAFWWSKFGFYVVYKLILRLLDTTHVVLSEFSRTFPSSIRRSCTS